MHSRAKGPTKDEQKRFVRLVDLGCVSCIKEYRHCPLPIEIHHLLDGGARRGHSETVSLCSWHHRGVLLDGVPVRNMVERYGPSLALNGKAFRGRYGSDDELLTYTNQLLEETP